MLLTKFMTSHLKKSGYERIDICRSGVGPVELRDFERKHHKQNEAKRMISV